MVISHVPATTVLVILADGFEEIEAFTPIDLLRRAGAKVLVAALADGIHVTGRSGVTVHADLTFSAVEGSEFSCVVIPGGPGVQKLRGHSGLPSDIPMKLIQLHFAGVPTYTQEIFYQIYWGKIPLYRINPIWLFQDGFRVAREPVFERLKRASDILLSLLGLVFASVLILVAAIAIKLDDGGAVFFEQSRIGKNKVPFKLRKLRTMRTTAESGELYTQKGDSRITRAGKVLRTMRLDELPQLWNVLRGDMSLIGPRAEWDRLVAEYEREIPCYHFRHLVKPGITGWAQVNYPYGSNVQDTLRKLEYDLYYIRNFSFTLDASIVLKTLHVMLFQNGR